MPSHQDNAGPQNGDPTPPQPPPIPSSAQPPPLATAAQVPPLPSDTQPPSFPKPLGKSERRFRSKTVSLIISLGFAAGAICAAVLFQRTFAASDLSTPKKVVQAFDDALARNDMATARSLAIGTEEQLAVAKQKLDVSAALSRMLIAGVRKFDGEEKGKKAADEEKTRWTKVDERIEGDKATVPYGWSGLLLPHFQLQKDGNVWKIDLQRSLDSDSSAKADQKLINVASEITEKTQNGHYKDMHEVLAAFDSEEKQALATTRPQASPSASPGIDPALTKFLAILSGEVPRLQAEGPQSDTQKQRTAGSLAREHLVSFKGAIYELSGWNRKNKESPSTYWEMVENLRVGDVLSCEYYTEYTDIISRPFNFWYQKKPDGLDELLKKLSDDHPIRQIGPERDNAPRSVELAMQANQESAKLVKKDEEDLKKWRASEAERKKNAGGGFLEWLAKCAELGIVIGLHEKEQERQHYESIQQIVAASGGKKMICPECNGSGKTVHTSDGFNKYAQNPYSLGTQEANAFEERRETVHVSTCSKCGGTGVVDR